MVKILQINSYANWGSTGKIAEQIGSAVMTQGWESYIAYGRQRILTPSTSHTIRIGNDLDVRVHGLVSRLFDRHGLASKHATRRFIQQVESFAPDLIHLHNIHGYYLNYEILFEYLAKVDIPVVWTLHDCWPFTGHCPYFDYVKCEYWKSGCRDCVQRKGFPTSWFVDNSKANYTLKKKLFTSLGPRLTLVPVSEWLTGLLDASFFRGQASRVIHNGIDTSVFSPQDPAGVKGKYRLNGKKIILGVASPWSSRKGLGDFLNLRRNLSDNQFSILLVGLSESQKKSLPENIIGISRTNDVNELACLYTAADVFVNPTYEDNYPTVNLEAMACGTPVITYRTGGSPEAVTPETGAIVDQGDITQLTDAILEIVQNDKSTYSVECRKRAESHFDKRDRFAEYIDLYNRILQG